MTRPVTGRAADRCGECGHMRKKHLLAGCLTCFKSSKNAHNFRHKFVESEEK